MDRMPLHRFYITTQPENAVCLMVELDDPREVVMLNPKLQLLFKLRECAWWEYILFKDLGINVRLKKGMRTYWTKRRLKEWLKKLWAVFSARIAESFTRTR